MSPHPLRLPNYDNLVKMVQDQHNWPLSASNIIKRELEFPFVFGDLITRISCHRALDWIGWHP